MVAAPYPLGENVSLPNHQEKAARLLAAGELSIVEIAARSHITEMTLWRWRQDPAMQARIQQLRDQFRDTAMQDEPFADKRLRVVSLGAVARDTLDHIQAHNYEETYYVGQDALEAKRFDAPRVESFRKYLSEIAEEMGDRGSGKQQSISLNVGVAVALSTEERVGRLAGLVARLDAPGT